MGVLLSDRSQLDSTLCQLVFDEVVVVGFIAYDKSTLWQIEIEDLKATSVACGTSGQEELNRLTLLGDHHVNLEAIKVTLLGGGVASILFTLIELAARYPNVVAGSDREAVQDVDAISVQPLPHMGKDVEQAEELMLDPVEATTQAALTQHTRDVALFFEEGTGQSIIASKVKRSHDGDGHYLCITELTLWVFTMIQGFQKILTQAVNKYNSDVHGVSLLFRMMHP